MRSRYSTAIPFSWLKTVRTGVIHMKPSLSLRPREVNMVAAEPTSVVGYQSHIIGPDAEMRVGEVVMCDRCAMMRRGAGDCRPEERRFMLQTIVYQN
jgi:hypothetical protein